MVNHLAMAGITRLILLVALVAMAELTGAWSAGGPQTQVPCLPQTQVPCLFIFGDSLVDNGNNNNILTLARANYPPYGIDYPEGSSGRFTNGRTMVDVLAQLLGFRSFIRSYASAQVSADILRGLNYASGAAGIRAETGDNLGDHYPLEQQVNHFRNTVSSLTRMFRGNTTRVTEYLGKCIYFMGMGSNDYLNNYFMPAIYPSSQDFSPKTFAALLIQDYSRQLTEMYDLGARKVAIVGVGQIGCIPYELARYAGRNSKRGGSSCNEDINKAISIYNNGLVKMINRFNSQFPDAKFTYINTFESSKDLASNAASYGFNVIDKGCCGVGRNNGQITCLPFQIPCPDRSIYLFWDAFHPTEVANVIYARKAYNSSSASDVYPMNIRQLAMA